MYIYRHMHVCILIYIPKQVKEALVRLSTLHALYLLDSASGDLLASGFLSPAQAPLLQVPSSAPSRSC